MPEPTFLVFENGKYYACYKSEENEKQVSSEPIDPEDLEVKKETIFSTKIKSNEELSDKLVISELENAALRRTVQATIDGTYFSLFNPETHKHSFETKIDPGLGYIVSTAYYILERKSS